MAASIVTDQGLTTFLANALAPRLFVRLFNNNIPVSFSSVLGDFTQATFPGYADLELTGLWSAPAIDSVERAFSRITTLSWTRGAGGLPETIYGYVIYQNPVPTSVLVDGKLFTAPVIMSLPGQVIPLALAAFLLRG